MIFHLLPNGQGGEVLAAFCDDESSSPFNRSAQDMQATLGCNLKDLDAKFVDCSFGSRAPRFSDLLIESLRQADGGHERRYHFDWLEVRSGILEGAEVLGVGTTKKRRERALQVALLMYGLHVAQLQGAAWNDIFVFYAHISLIRFQCSVVPSSLAPGASSGSAAIPSMPSQLQGVWAEPAENVTLATEAWLSKADSVSDNVDSASGAAYDVTAGSGAPMFPIEVGDIVFTRSHNPHGIVLKWYTGPPNDSGSRAMPRWPDWKSSQPPGHNLGACTAVSVFDGRAWCHAQQCYVRMQYQTVCLPHPVTGEEGYVNIWCSHGKHLEPGGVRYAAVVPSGRYNFRKCPRK